MGWNTKANGSGEEYQPGEQIIVESNIILYAIWHEVEINFNISRSFENPSNEIMPVNSNQNIKYTITGDMDNFLIGTMNNMNVKITEKLPVGVVILPNPNITIFVKDGVKWFTYEFEALFEERSTKIELMEKEIIVTVQYMTEGVKVFSDTSVSYEVYGQEKIVTPNDNLLTCYVNVPVGMSTTSLANNRYTITVSSANEIDSGIIYEQSTDLLN